MAKNGSFLIVSSALMSAVASSCGGDTSPVTDPVMMGDDDPTGDDTPEPSGDTPEPVAAPTEQDSCTGLTVPMTPVETLPAGAIECTYDCVPNEKVTDFTIWNEGATTVWGDDMSLTGGTFEYKNDGVDGSENLTVEVDAAAGTAHITGNVIGGYAGWGLWFGPCSDASRFTGIRFVIGGSLGEFGELEFQVQQNNNYPIDSSNSKGACGGTWTDGCGSNAFVYEEEFPAEPAEIQVPFASLTGGSPNAIEAAELLGVQWQFNCEEEEVCAVDVYLTEVTFY
jgi:hypothetical protein